MPATTRGALVEPARVRFASPSERDAIGRAIGRWRAIPGFVGSVSDEIIGALIEELSSHTTAVLSNCPQMHNPSNGYNPTPIQVVIYKPLAAPGSA